MRTSTLCNLAALLLAATTFKWSQVRGGRTIGDLYRDAKAGRLRTSLYSKAASMGSLALIVLGMYLLLSGD
jgi:hypothetical protein